jgi:hypothetical protein
MPSFKLKKETCKDLIFQTQASVCAPNNSDVTALRWLTASVQGVFSFPRGNRMLRVTFCVGERARADGKTESGKRQQNTPAPLNPKNISSRLHAVRVAITSVYNALRTKI